MRQQGTKRLGERAGCSGTHLLLFRVFVGGFEFMVGEDSVQLWRDRRLTVARLRDQIVRGSGRRRQVGSGTYFAKRVLQRALLVVMLVATT
jgi:hypothetical protein